MRLKYHKQIVDMLYQEWDLGNLYAEAKGKTCAWIYWFGIQSEAEKVIIEKQDNKIVGICGYSNWKSKKHKIRKTFYGILKKLTINSPLIKHKEGIYRYNRGYNYLPKELEDYFDGEIEILIVDKNYRGKGIGIKLLSKAFEYAAKDHMKNIEILSDESCNYKFYEDFGCTKFYETMIPNAELDKCKDVEYVKGYIYEKNLGKCNP